jgi:hypothetical protein
MHPQLTLILAQEHIADLRRAADHYRLVQAATTTRGGMRSWYSRQKPKTTRETQFLASIAGRRTRPRSAL